MSADPASVRRTLASSVARSIRAHRQASGLSLGALAARSGVSKAAVSTLESGAGNPSLETLWRLAEALGLPLGSLLGELEPPRTRLVRAGEGTPVTSESGLTAALLVSEGRPHRTEVLTFELPAGSDYQAAPHKFRTEELVFCVSGSLEVGPLGQEERLRAGDCLWFPADVEHRYASLRGAQGLNVISYPTASAREA